MNRVIQLGVAFGCFYCATAQAVLIVGQQQYNATDVLPSPIVAVAGDLLETSVASFSGENAAALVRNGFTGTAFQTTGTGPASVWGITTTTYNLDVSVNTLGYDISEIRLFSGWQDSRSGQSYEIFYSLVGNAAFTSLGAVLAPQGTGSPGSGGSLLTRTYDSLSAVILTGVDAIQFTQGSGIPGDGTVFREFDVIGVATVPEPGTFAMLLFGGAFLWFVKGRRA